MPRRRQSHHWIHAAERTIATTRHSTPSHLFDCKAECYVNQILGGSHYQRLVRENFLCQSGSYMTSCQLQVQSPQRSRRRHDGQQFELQQRPDAAAEETGPNCGANGTEWSHVWSQGESAACKRGWINHVITERQHGSRRRFLLRAAAKVKNRTEPHSEISQSIELLLQ
jgi:hypothetical protein